MKVIKWTEENRKTLIPFFRDLHPGLEDPIYGFIDGSYLGVRDNYLWWYSAVSNKRHKVVTMEKYARIKSSLWIF